MKLPIKVIGAFAVLAAFALQSRADVKVGQPFPALGALGLEGTLPPLSNRVVLLDFWATWCGPCKESFPEYSKLQDELSGRGFTVLAISLDKRAKDYQDFLSRMSPRFPTMRDGSFALATVVRPPGMPTSYLIDKHGVLRLVHTGFHGKGDIAALRTEINRLLEE